MKSAQNILLHHEQKHKNSCVAWGLEAILKMHEKIGLDDYPLQNGTNPCGYGFGQHERKILESHGISSSEHFLDLDSFEQMAKEEYQKGFPPIFSIPDHLEVKNNVVHIILHVWIAVLEAGSLKYLSRSHGQAQILPPLPLPAVFNDFCAQVASNYRIHCIFHKNNP